MRLLWPRLSELKVVGQGRPSVDPLDPDGLRGSVLMLQLSGMTLGRVVAVCCCCVRWVELAAVVAVAMSDD